MFVNTVLLALNLVTSFGTLAAVKNKDLFFKRDLRMRTNLEEGPMRMTPTVPPIFDPDTINAGKGATATFQNAVNAGVCQ